MYSGEGERVALVQSISTSEAKGAVEKWLVQVEDVMLRSVRDVISRSREVSCLNHFVNSLPRACLLLVLFDSD